jgi:hypothetical protein
MILPGGGLLQSEAFLKPALGDTGIESSQGSSA